MKKVLILLAEGFEEIEALGTADILRRMGVEVVLAAMKKETVSGSHNITVTADAVFDKVDKNEFDAVVLPLVFGPPMLMTRNLLYTAVTRAKRLVVIVGRESCIQQMETTAKYFKSIMFCTEEAK